MGQICGPGVLCDLDKGGRWTDEGGRKVDQLALELRMLKDENYRIREEQLRLEKELRSIPADRSRARRGSTRPGQDQVMYMKEVIRNLQAENSRLRRDNDKSAQFESVNASPTAVSEVEYRQLEGQLRMLQHRQAHHARMQVGSAGVSTAVSGVSTPLSMLNEDPRTRQMTAHYEALQRDQLELRNKVRRLARG
ncbi:unnamed protein product [Effrenium voratum]|nr:unnamed protein product [Effrenium voratum]|mmetsp:Transcript_7581/g.18172  ORF Transcript_7581/g.18172 Transcript_7581/m.18172 type:complete len:194 (+) Transcript_7581:32-613(+)